MMNTKSITRLSPQVAAQYAERAKRMDGCVKVGTSGDIYEFAQNSTVICLIHLDPPEGHYGKDAYRADQIRKQLAELDCIDGRIEGRKE